MGIGYEKITIFIYFSWVLLFIMHFNIIYLILYVLFWFKVNSYPQNAEESDGK